MEYIVEWLLQWLPFLLGYAFAILVGHFLISLVVSALWRREGWRDLSRESARPSNHLPKLIGVTERALYVAAIHLGHPEFVGVWLALKVAGQWNRWSQGEKIGDRLVAGRVFYNIFLIGSGLSIAYALVGASLIGQVQDRDWNLAVTTPAVLIAGTLVLWRLSRGLEDVNGD